MKTFMRLLARILFNNSINLATMMLIGLWLTLSQLVDEGKLSWPGQLAIALGALFAVAFGDVMTEDFRARRR